MHTWHIHLALKRNQPSGELAALFSASSERSTTSNGITCQGELNSVLTLAITEDSMELWKQYMAHPSDSESTMHLWWPGVPHRQDIHAQPLVQALHCSRPSNPLHSSATNQRGAWRTTHHRGMEVLQYTTSSMNSSTTRTSRCSHHHSVQEKGRKIWLLQLSGDHSLVLDW